MSHNIALMRQIHAHLTAHPHLHDQSRWPACAAGWAVKFAGRHVFVRTPHSPTDGMYVIEAQSGERFYTDEVAAELLGLTPDEAQFLFAEADNEYAVGWLADTITAHETRVFAALSAELADDGYPLGEVTA